MKRERLGKFKTVEELKELGYKPLIEYTVDRFDNEYETIIDDAFILTNDMDEILSFVYHKTLKRNISQYELIPGETKDDLIEMYEKLFDISIPHKVLKVFLQELSYSGHTFIETKQK